MHCEHVLRFYSTMLRSKERGYVTVSLNNISSVWLPLCLSDCLSVTFRHVSHTAWNTSKIISLLISLRFLLGLTPTWAIWSNRNTRKISINGVRVMSTKTWNGAR